MKAKGLEPSNLLTARQLNGVAACVGSSRIVASWLVRTAVQRILRNGVQLRAALRDAFVGSNVWLSCGGGQEPADAVDGWLSSRSPVQSEETVTPTWLAANRLTPQPVRQSSTPVIVLGVVWKYEG